MKALRKALAPLRRRIRHIRLHRGLALGAVAGAGLWLALSVTGFFLPIRNGWLWGFGSLVGATLLSGLINALRPVSLSAAAALGDAYGLQERLQTTMSHGNQTPMEQLQRQDTLAALRSFDSSALPLPQMKRLWLTSCLSVVVCLGLLLLPNPQRAVIQQNLAFEQAMEKAARQAEEMQVNQSLTEKQKQEVRKLLDELSRELRKARNPMEAMLALSKGEERLEAMKQRMAGETQEAMSNALMSQGMDALAQALQSGDAQQLTQSLEGLDAHSLQEAAEQLGGDAGEMLRQAAQALQAGDLQQMMAQLTQIAQSLQGDGITQLSQLSKALTGMRGASGMTGQGHEGKGKGNGAGKGSTNEDQTQSVEDASGIRGNEDPRYKEGIYEQIYDPTRLDAEETMLSSQSPKGEGDSVQVELAPGAGSLNGYVPYQQVVEEYAQAAAQAANQQDLTREERQWVADYFTALTE